MGDAFRVNFYRSSIKTGIKNAGDKIKTGIESVKTDIEKSETGIRYVMGKLKAKGILRREGATKKGRWIIDLHR